MNRSKGASSNLVLDHVLVDMMLRLAIFLIVRVLGSGIQRLFDFPVDRSSATMVSEWALVGR